MLSGDFSPKPNGPRSGTTTGFLLDPNRSKSPQNIIGSVASIIQTNLVIEIPNITENYVHSHVFTCRHWVSAMLI